MLELLNQLSQVNSPAEKVRMLKEYPYQGELKDLLKMSTDPFIRFGLTDFEVHDEPSKVSPWSVLKKLHSRELTGNEARIELGKAVGGHPSDIELFRRIIRKDLRCGIGEKLVLQAYPGLIRTFEVMRADKFKWTKDEYYAEPKMDGLRCIVVVEKKSVNLLTRNGLEITSCEHLKDQILSLGSGDGVFDGELTAGNFNESCSVKRKSEQNPDAKLHVFDFLTAMEWDDPQILYRSRRRRLEEIMSNQREGLVLVEAYPISSEDEAIDYYRHFLSRGFEGTIIKRARGKYHFKRHRDWMKIKECQDVDLRVESLVQGEGKYYGMLGSVIVNYKGKRVNVGTGFSDEERAYYWKNPNELRGKTIEIQYHQETPDGSLRHSRFIKVRLDK